MDMAPVMEIIRRYEGNPGALIAILQDVQSEYRYLPREALEVVADRRRVPLSQVYGLANFFRAFSLEPRGRHLIHVCTGTACHVRGAPLVLEEIERQLGITSGQTTEDRLFTLETVNCVGACALGPVVIVDQDYHANMEPGRVTDVLHRYANGGGPAEGE
jgi:NADH-quinone oxidoreductase subunit E